MTNRAEIPSEVQVRALMDQLVREAAENSTRPSVLALAHRCGLSNTTFRRHFPDIATELADYRAGPTEPATIATGSTRATLVARNAKLKRANKTLTDQLKIAAAQIHRLSIDNHNLRESLHRSTGVRRLFSGGRTGSVSREGDVDAPQRDLGDARTP